MSIVGDSTSDIRKKGSVPIFLLIIFSPTPVLIFIYSSDSCMGFPITLHFSGKCWRNSFHFNISLIELLQ